MYIELSTPKSFPAAFTPASQIVQNDATPLLTNAILCRLPGVAGFAASLPLLAAGAGSLGLLQAVNASTKTHASALQKNLGDFITR
jgi:hypothetical protein